MQRAEHAGEFAKTVLVENRIAILKVLMGLSRHLMEGWMGREHLPAGETRAYLGLKRGHLSYPLTTGISCAIVPILKISADYTGR